MSLIQVALQEIAELGLEVYTELQPHHGGAYYTCEAYDESGWNVLYIYPDGQWHFDS